MSKSVKSIVVTANVIEWYDYIIFAFLAPQIAINFFHNDTGLGVFKALAIFAISYAARPLGAVVLGWLSDRYGFRRSMFVSMLLVCIPAGFIAVMPGSSSIGIWAPVLLLVLRLLQSLGMGAEYPLAAEYAYTHSENNCKIFNTGLSAISATGGMILGSSVIAILSWVLTKNEMNVWGWRLIFALSIPASLYIYKLRSSITAYTKNKHSEQTENDTTSLLLLITLIVLGMLMIGAAESIFYTTRIYMPTYLIQYLHISTETAHVDNTIVMIAAAVLILPCCYLAQKKGTRHIMMGCSLFFILAAFPLYAWLLHANKFEVLLPQLLLSIGTVGFGVCNLPVLNEVFEQLHAKGLSICLAYTCGAGLLSGPSILLADYLIHTTGNHLMPGILVVIYAVIVIITISAIKWLLGSYKNHTFYQFNRVNNT